MDGWMDGYTYNKYACYYVIIKTIEWTKCVRAGIVKDSLE